MSVRLRLSRIGKKKAPFYRVVAVDQRVKRDGAFIDAIGTINALTGEIIQFDTEKYNSWIGKGAQPSDSVAKFERRVRKGELAPINKKTVRPVAGIFSAAQ